MTTFSAARRALALLLALCLLPLGALPAQADGTPFTVEGRVVFPEGHDPADVADTYLLLMPLTGNAWIRADMKPNGEFSVTAPDSSLSYRLRFYDSGSTLYGGYITADGSVTDATPARIFSGDTENVIVTPRTTSVVSGRIALPEGTDREASTFQIISYSRSSSSWAGNGSLSDHRINPDGTFEFRGLDAGKEYRFELRDLSDNLVSGYLGDGAYVEHFIDAHTVVAPTSILFEPFVASSISGRLTAPAGVNLSELIADRDVTVRHAPAPDAQPRFESYDRADVFTDGRFTFRGLWPGNPFLVAAWTPSGVLEGGMVDADGAVTLDAAHARVLHPGDTDVNIAMRRPTQISGTVELPEGFDYDPEAPPTVRPLPQTAEVTSLQRSQSRSVPVGPDGSFTTERTHSQSEFVLELTWPDGSIGYWTSNDTTATADLAQAAHVRPRGDIVFPSTNRMVNRSAPSISGEVRLGATLRADGGTWSASAPTLTYQWLRSGTAITGATGTGYVISADDVGARLAVRVTATAAEFPSATATSVETAVVPDPVASAPVAPKVTVKVLPKRTTKGKVRARVTVRAAEVTDRPVGTLRVKFAKQSRTVKLKAKHRGSRVVTIKRSKARGALKVRFVPTGASAERLKATTTKVKVAKTSPKVTVKAPKRITRGAALRTTLRVDARGLTAKPTGKLRVLVNGQRVHTVTLKARHQGRIKVTLPGAVTRQTTGALKIRVRYTPAPKWRPYLKTKKSKVTTTRVR